MTKILGPDGLPVNINQLSPEKQREENRKVAISQERLQNLGTAILIQEPSEQLVAFRQWLNHPANSDIQAIAAERITMNAVLSTVAAHLGYDIHSAATNSDVHRILGDLATRLQKRAAIRASN